MNSNLHNNIFSVLFISSCLLLLQANSYEFIANVLCVPCSVTCKYPMCYKVVTNDFTSQYCGDMNCPFMKSYSQKINNCQKGIFGANCTSGACTALMNSGCFALTAISQCALASNNLVYCGNCKSTPGCSQCRIVDALALGAQAQVCIGQSCSQIQSLNMTTYPCTSDINGNKCGCCYTVNSLNKNGAAYQAGICTTDHDIFYRDDFTAYVKARLAGMDQGKIKMVSLFVFSMILFMLFYK